MNNEDKKMQKQLVDEMMKVSKTNPDVMIYMQALMQKYEELEQKNIELSQQLLSKKISDKDIEYKKRIEIQQELDQYKNNWEELKKWVKEQDDEHQPYYGTYEYNGEYEDVLDKMKELEEDK